MVERHYNPEQFAKKKELEDKLLEADCIDDVLSFFKDNPDDLEIRDLHYGVHSHSSGKKRILQIKEYGVLFCNELTGKEASDFHYAIWNKENVVMRTSIEVAYVPLEDHPGALSLAEKTGGEISLK